MLGEKRAGTVFFQAAPADSQVEEMAQESQKRENRREPDSHIVETPSRPEDEEKPERKKGVGSQEPERVVCTPQKKQPPSPIPQLVKEEKEAAAEIEVEEEEDEEDAAVFRQGGTALRTHNLFVSPQNEAREFTSVLQEVQEYISSQYSTLIMDDDSEETREQIKRYITKYVQDNRIAVKGMDGQVLIDTMYTEMAGFSFLHKYVFGEGIEEIDSATRS